MSQVTPILKIAETRALGKTHQKTFSPFQDHSVTFRCTRTLPLSKIYDKANYPDHYDPETQAHKYHHSRRSANKIIMEFQPPPSTLLPLILLTHLLPPPTSSSTTQSITPWIFQLNFKPPPRRISSPHPPSLPPKPQPLRRQPQYPQIEIEQTPAQDRFYDSIISFPATIVPKLFGDKPFWVPHAYFNMCPFVRGPEIDPVWSAGCAPLPYSEMPNVNPQNYQEVYTRLQAMQQAQEQAEKLKEPEPSWWETNRPQGPTDFGYSQYFPMQQQEMYNYGAEGDSGGAIGSRRGTGGQGPWGLWSFFG